MTTLIRTEWLKMRKYNAFWWILGLTALSYPGINYIFYMVYDNITHQPSQAGQLAKMVIGNPFAFPEVWHTVAYSSSIFVFIPAVVIIMFITNEYTFKTHRQNIIDGWSRSQFISSKLIDVLLVTLMITVLYFAVSLVAGVTNQTRLIQDTWNQSYYIGLFALQTFAQLSIAFLIGFLVRKAFIALGIFLFYFMIFEPIIVGLLKVYGNDNGRFMPLEISDRMIPVPAFIGKIDKEAYDKSLTLIQQHVIFTIVLTAIIWAICYRINNKRDLK
ncbi:MAG: ABC transporter permease [Chitinophagaceae bacterium]|nr:ABC transporter permease [Chitinophagaceae bacterium]MBL0272013.1 ABC transporter permease [Chitinophagaceae bacterium]